MFRLVKSETVPLTRELAEQFRDLEPSPTEREISPSRMKMLRQKAEAGQLVTFQWSRARLGERVWRMNGQHSANMLCELNGKFPEGLYAHIDDYDVDQMDGLALLFRQFDDRKSGRTVGDVAGAYQGLVPELVAVPRDIAKLGIEGIAWYERYVEGISPPAGDDVYNLFNRAANHPFLQWLGSLFDIKTPELRERTTVAAMFGTFVTSETGAREFWHQVARGGIEYEDQAPSTVLDRWLKTYEETKPADRAKAGLAGLKPADFYSGCVYAWNAYRRNKPIRDIQHDSKKGLPPIAD
jgi:hypothetical protein